jgi:hypothetical protein
MQTGVAIMAEYMTVKVLHDKLAELMRMTSGGVDWASAYVCVCDDPKDDSDETQLALLTDMELKSAYEHPAGMDFPNAPCVKITGEWW